MDYCRMFLARRNTKPRKIIDIRETILNEMRRLDIQNKTKPRMRVAITAGSRGISNNALILGTVVSELKSYGCRPFLVPSMGSHGGGTPEGQLEVLRGLGVTETSIGCPIISQMDVVKLADTVEGFPVFIDKAAAGADGIVVVNRIKPHTEYSGNVESGLFKMMVIGLGKLKGALTAHQYTVKYGYEFAILSIGREILKSAPILFGLAVVENNYDEIDKVVVLWPDLFEENEKTLLKKAKTFLATLPFKKLDILIVDEMGKEISGTGIDTNVIGRIMFTGSPEPKHPRITRIVVLDLTEESHGNALGVGLADFVTRRLVNKIDHRTTYINCFTAMTPEKARIPAMAETDQEAIDWAFQTIGAIEPQQARVVKIRNTLHLNEIFISQSLVSEIKAETGWEIEKKGHEMRFDSKGNLHLS